MEEMQNYNESAGGIPENERYREDPIYLRDGRRQVDYVIVYNSDETKHADSRSVFEGELQKEGLEIEYETINTTPEGSTEQKKIVFVKLHAPWEVLSKWAEISRVPKPIAINNLVGSDEDECLSIKRLWKKLTAVPHPTQYGYKYTDHENDDQFFTASFDRTRKDKFLIEDKENFFSIAERQRIVLNILNRTRFGDSDLDVGINRLIDKECYESVFPLHEGDWKLEHMKDGDHHGGTRLNKRQTLYWIWARPRMAFSAQPLELIRQYFGEKIGLYFAWLGYYTWMLVPVSLFGIFTFIYGIAILPNDKISHDICQSNRSMCPRCDDEDCPFWKLKDSCLYTKITRIFDNEMTLFFAFVMSLWATFFLEFWKRKRAELVYKWDLENFEEEEDQVRPEYENICPVKKMNPITGTHEPFLPFMKKVPRVVGSVSVFFVLLTLVIGSVFGVVVYRVIIGAIIPQFSSGVVKKNASLITSISASILNFIVITIFNIIYEKIAVALTNLEAPRTATDFEDSFTLKMFLFQAVNYYSSIFYIAFFKGKFNGTPYKYNKLFGFRAEECDPSGCLIELCIQLAIIMILKQALNNTTEIFIPLLKNWWKKRTLKHGKSEDEESLQSDMSDSALLRDYGLEDPEREYLFSEYLEMVIQFGFVTLFVASFPLAPLFALLNNIIEIRLDGYKFTTQIRRLPAKRAENIGMWFPILEALSTLSVITNGVVIAFTSDFVPRLVYLVLYSPCSDDAVNRQIDNCYEGYINSTLMSIPVEQVDRIPRYNSSDTGVPDECWFRASDPSLPSQPILQYWHVVAGRIAFILLFEHVVFGLKLFIDLIIPDIPKSLVLQMGRQRFLELKLLYEQDDRDAAKEVVESATKSENQPETSV